MFMRLSNFKKLFIYICILGLVSLSNVMASTCRIAEGRLNFGKYDNLGADASAKTVGEITVICSNMTGDVNYSLALTNNKLSIANGKGGLLYYNLYTSPNYTALWNENNLITGTVKNLNGTGTDVKAMYGEVILMNKNNMTAGEYTSNSNPPMVKLIY
jgi:spore coat protein U-like protein